MGLLFPADNAWRAELIRAALAQGRTINGLESLAVDVTSPSSATVSLTFLANDAALSALTTQNFVVESPLGERPFRVNTVTRKEGSAALLLAVSGPIDSTRYTLRLVRSPSDAHAPTGFDPFVVSGSLVFLAVADSADPIVDAAADPTFPPTAHVDYLTKDYQSFRRMMLDRLAVLRPDWNERNPADLGMAIIETLAYAADHASYYQDAVGTEAHLGTARRRISVRRHARLLDYHMHDGRNSRVFVAVTVRQSGDGLVLPGAVPGSASSAPQPGTAFLTRVDGLPPASQASQFNPAVAPSAQIFEAMHDVVVYSGNNEIPIHTWGQRSGVLPQGATQATLIASSLYLNPGYSLQPGDLLLFEEHNPTDVPTALFADPGHRHVVRLTRVTPQEDPLFSDLLTGTPPLRLLEVEWAPADALPFALSLAALSDSGGSALPPRLGVARGNIVLADHGQTQPVEALVPVQNAANRPGYDYYPLLRGPLTQQGHMQLPSGQTVPLSPTAPASAAIRCSLTSVHPAITLSHSPAGPADWQSDRDLLLAGRGTQKFVVEIDDEARAFLRFGDGTSGAQPRGDLYATYRIGNGRAGNIGAESLGHALLLPPSADQRRCDINDLVSVRNPLPASGGEDPESNAEVKRKAPQAYRTQQRAVTEEDYAALLTSHPEVRQAKVVRRFTGSFSTLFLYVDRRDGIAVDEAFRQRLLSFLEPYRLAGHDLRIEGPRFVPLDLSVAFTLVRGANAREAIDALSAALSDADLPGGGRGLFHPDRLYFGQSIYVSQILGTVMTVPGVQSARIQRFRRYGSVDDSELSTQQLTFQSLELPRLRNRSGRPNRDGALELISEGNP